MPRIMIIACPACATRYDVADSSIGVDGRVVRCAKCRHSWFQDGPQQDEALGEVSLDEGALDEGAPHEGLGAEPTATLALPPAEPVPEAPSFSEPAADTPIPVPPPGPYSDDAAARDFADTPSSFAHEPPFRPRRNRGAMWLIAVMLAALVVLAGVGAVAQFGLPDWLPRSVLTKFTGAFGGAAPDLVLDFPQNRQERRPLPNGSDFFNVSGSIRNVGNIRRAVPTLLIVLRDANNAIVYSLETASPKQALAPGESEMVNQAIIDAPSSARSADIGWKPG